MVWKGSEAWRMCIDYTDLNKACPKDSFSLPRIDLLVDTTSRHQMLSLMDAYSSYNQIKMNLTDEEATSFQTDRGSYFYQVMPFRLKNVGATYQHLMNKDFKTLIGHTIEVFVDDMLVKSLKKS
ncbi:RNA-directed DNA polymerase [Dendrobium catenatum]|uniref:RNA-directed DNA polymerase n=1 Tax=Dendrobium catenatum TaxID=906689 RepID=A0A2I0WBN8_9ASPA|nr:RNA-directed DNA polymerase [Dendrobium catenatum]